MRLYEILDKTIKKLGIDWIIESSTQDGWTIEKWHSGKMVQTLYKSRDNTGWTDIPYTSGILVSYKGYTFPQSFAGTPTVLASASGGSGIGVGVTTHPTSTNVNLHVSGSQSCKSTEARDISIIAIGKYR